MNLEDHSGDVLRKARTASTMTLEAAAMAANLSMAQYADMESSGVIPAGADLAGVAGAVGLNPSRLMNLARGWRPPPVDLAQWRELRVITTTLDGNTVNCFLVWDEVTREAALFDTGWRADPVLDVIRDNALMLRHLFVTHTHEDHIAAMAALREQYPKLLLHTNARSAPPQHRNRANDFIHLGSLRITNRDTPGHAEDGVTYIIGTWPDDAPHVAVVGDCLFAGSMGGAPSAHALARQKVRDQVFSLPPATLICPGHGPLTTVGEELENNPFF